MGGMQFGCFRRFTQTKYYNSDWTGDVMVKLSSGGAVLLGFIVMAPLVLYSQSVGHERTRADFVSSDGVFRVSYPDSAVACRRDPNQTDWWLPSESCDADTPVCSDVFCDSTETAVCIAYPAGQMKGTSFQAAGFSVNELKKIATEADCLRVDEPPPQVGRVRNETVNGVKFIVVETDGVGAGNFIDGYAYRTFHRNRCYELDIRIAYSNPANAEAGTMKDFDLKVVHRQLKQILDTFTFLK